MTNTNPTSTSSSSHPSKQLLFPLPPRYFRLYTEENLQLYQEQKRLEAEGHSLEHAVQDLFQPTLDPPPILQGTYRMFGHILTTEHKVPTLAEAGIEQLYPKEEFDHPTFMKQITVQILQEILNLLQSLPSLSKNSTNTTMTTADSSSSGGDSALKSPLPLPSAATSSSPSSTPTSFISHLNTLFLNLLHLINNYRSHQAIETFTLSLEKQVFDAQQSLQSILKKMKQTHDILQHLYEQPLASALPEISDTVILPKRTVVSSREQIWQQMLELDSPMESE